MGRFASVAILLVACGGSGGSAGGDGGPGHDGMLAGDGSSNVDAPGTGVDAAPMQCGDGIRVRGEECDDHNTTSGDGCDSTCHVEPPAGASQAQIDEMHAVNALRAEADVPGRPMDPHANQSSSAHASYYANNPAAYAGGLSPHLEDASFPNGFTGVQFFDRMSAAGVTGNAMFETMAFSGNPTSAVGQWQNSVFHRVPLLHPSMGSFGYGLATGADVSDFESGAAEKPGAVIVWPPPNATGIPGSFNTQQEGPNPPPPPGGGSVTGPIISILFASGTTGTVDTHILRDAGGAMVAHTLVTPQDATVGPFLVGTFAMYAAGPAASGAKFTVEITGTAGGQAYSKAWSFTTQ